MTLSSFRCCQIGKILATKSPLTYSGDQEEGQATEAEQHSHRYERKTSTQREEETLDMQTRREEERLNLLWDDYINQNTLIIH